MLVVAMAVTAAGGAGPAVPVIVRLEAPVPSLGVEFDGALRLKRFVRDAHGRANALEATGQVRLGDRLSAVNGQGVSGIGDAVSLLRGAMDGHDAFDLHFERGAVAHSAHEASLPPPPAAVGHSQLSRAAHGLDGVHADDAARARAVAGHREVMHRANVLIRWGDRVSGMEVREPAELALFGPSPLGRRPAPLHILADSEGCRDYNAVDEERAVRAWVLAARGTCAFGDKALQAQAHGAVGLLIVNHDEAACRPEAAAHIAPRVRIPVLCLSHGSFHRIQNREREARRARAGPATCHILPTAVEGGGNGAWGQAEGGDAPTLEEQLSAAAAASDGLMPDPMVWRGSAAAVQRPGGAGTEPGTSGELLVFTATHALASPFPGPRASRRAWQGPHTHALAQGHRALAVTHPEWLLAGGTVPAGLEQSVLTLTWAEGEGGGCGGEPPMALEQLHERHHRPWRDTVAARSSDPREAALLSAEVERSPRALAVVAEAAEGVCSVGDRAKHAASLGASVLIVIGNGSSLQQRDEGASAAWEVPVLALPSSAGPRLKAALRANCTAQTPLWACAAAHGALARVRVDVDVSRQWREVHAVVGGDVEWPTDPRARRRLARRLMKEHAASSDRHDAVQPLLREHLGGLFEAEARAAGV